MKRLINLSILIVFVLMLATLSAEGYEVATASNPPISQPLVREGEFAVKLAFALGLGTTENEVEAENLLADTGIQPKNGWIADYPVTPDIAGEIRESLIAAADSGRLAKSREEALEAYQDVLNEYNLAFADVSGQNVPTDQGNPDSQVINNYYYNYGPPVVTYYAPPPDYAYLYTWVPYPFWWWHWWFPGFFVLVDFHKVIIVDRHPKFISNHFVDFKTRDVLRIDPVDRLHGKSIVSTLRDIRERRVIHPRTGRGGERVFSGGGRERAVIKDRAVVPRSGGERIFNSPSRSRTFVSPSGRSGISGPPVDRMFNRDSSRAFREFSRPAKGSFRGLAPSSSGARSFTAPFRGAENSLGSSAGRSAGSIRGSSFGGKVGR